MVRKRKTPPDGRVNSGGARVGQAGRAYPNRKDLNAAPVRTATGQGYGKAAAQAAAQAAVPMAGGTPPLGAPPGGQPGQPAAPMVPIPVDATPTLGQPSARPDEPLEAGLPFGPGRTPRPGQRPPDYVDDDIVDRLRALYLMHPTAELRELLEQ